MLKRLIRHGNSRALIIDKRLLEEAGVSEDSVFLISINPGGGLIIESVRNTHVEDIVIKEFRENFKKLNKEHKQLFKNLSEPQLSK